RICPRRIAMGSSTAAPTATRANTSTETETPVSATLISRYGTPQMTLISANSTQPRRLTVRPLSTTRPGAGYPDRGYPRSWGGRRLSGGGGVPAGTARAAPPGPPRRPRPGPPPGGPPPPREHGLPREPVLALPGALLAAVAGGLALTAAFPPVGAWPLAPLGPALLVLALQGRRLRSSLLAGLLFGLALFVPLLSWLINVAWSAWAALALAEQGS